VLLGLPAAAVVPRQRLDWSHNFKMDLDGDGRREQVVLRGETLLIDDVVAAANVDASEEHAKQWLEVLRPDPKRPERALLVFEPGIEDECTLRVVGYRRGHAETFLKVWLGDCQRDLRISGARIQIVEERPVDNEHCRLDETTYRWINGRLYRDGRKRGEVRACRPG